MIFKKRRPTSESTAASTVSIPHSNVTSAPINFVPGEFDSPFVEHDPLGQDNDLLSEQERLIEETARQPWRERRRREREEEKWEFRRWELVRYLVAQDRRSVVLGKLHASERTIARNARKLTDATIEELRTNIPNWHERDNNQH